jgi:hypothetical protein
MQIPRLTTGAGGASAYGSPGGVAGAAAVLNDASASLGQQLNAYQALAGRWRDARPGERAVLAQALTESPFAQDVQSTLNTFTRAAWAGPDAVPPAPQIQIAKAFDGLSGDEQQIVAAMHGGAAGVTPSDYRARLQADLEAAQPAETPRRSDSVTLSTEAQARLAAGEPAAPAPSAWPDTGADPQMGRAIAAYARAAG